MLTALAMVVALAGSCATGSVPSDQDVIRAMSRVPRGVPFVFEAFRADVVIVKNVLSQKNVGPQLLIPLVGPAQLTETHWECAAFYTQTTQIAFPFAVTVKKQCVDVVYIDKTALKFGAGK